MTQSISVGIMNVETMLPPHLKHAATGYKSRSVHLPSKFAEVPKGTDPTFVEFMHTHNGTVCVNGISALILKLFLPKYLYVPANKKLANLRSKAFSTQLALSGDLNLEVVPGTVVLPRDEFVSGIQQLLLGHPSIFVRLGQSADGGYGSSVFSRGVSPEDLHKYIAEATSPSYVCAPYIRDVLDNPGIGFTAKQTFAPNYNLMSKDLGTIGVALPYFGVDSWIADLIELGDVARRYVKTYAGGFVFSNADFLVLPDGKIYFCEFNTRDTFTRLCISGIWKAARHKNATGMSLDQYHEAFASGKLNMAFVASDKIFTQKISTAELTSCLAKVKIHPFDGRHGFLPTRSWADGSLGVILVSHSHSNSSRAMRQVTNMYHYMLDALEAEYVGELNEILSHI